MIYRRACFLWVYTVGHAFCGWHLHLICRSCTAPGNGTLGSRWSTEDRELSVRRVKNWVQSCPSVSPPDDGQESSFSLLLPSKKIAIILSFLPHVSITVMRLVAAQNIFLQEVPFSKHLMIMTRHSFFLMYYFTMYLVSHVNRSSMKKIKTKIATTPAKPPQRQQQNRRQKSTYSTTACCY